MGRKANWPPRISHHSSGQARVYVRGKSYYLGPYGSPEAEKAYRKLLADLEAGGKAPPDPRGPTVSAACLRYLEHAERHYRHPDGRPTSQMGFVRKALAVTCELFGRTLASEFRGRRLKEVRERMVSLGWCRRNVNAHVACVRRAWRWLAGEELVPPEAYQSLAAVAGLARGRTEARDPEPVGPADPAAVEATLPHLTPHLADAARLQLLTACRPGEALGCRPCDLEMRGGVWRWEPKDHKTAWRGKSRVILLGPKAQALVEGLLPRECPRCGARGRARRIAWRDTLCGPCADACQEAGVCGPWPWVRPPQWDGHLLDPVDSEDERLWLQRIRSRTPRRVQCRVRAGLKRHFTVGAYSKRVRLVCKRLGVPHWHPTQLRHSAATLIRAEESLELARCILGHSSIHTTRVYAEEDLKKAADFIRRVG